MSPSSPLSGWVPRMGLQRGCSDFHALPTTSARPPVTCRSCRKRTLSAGTNGRGSREFQAAPLGPTFILSCGVTSARQLWAFKMRIGRDSIASAYEARLSACVPAFLPDRARPLAGPARPDRPLRRVGMFRTGHEDRSAAQQPTCRGPGLPFRTWLPRRRERSTRHSCRQTFTDRTSQAVRHRRPARSTGSRRGRSGLARRLFRRRSGVFSGTQGRACRPSFR